MSMCHSELASITGVIPRKVEGKRKRRKANVGGTAAGWNLEMMNTLIDAGWLCLDCHVIKKENWISSFLVGFVLFLISLVNNNDL